MTPDDAAKVLLLVQVYDNRQFDETTARIWADALQGLELTDCLDAVRIYYRHSKDWLMPSDLRQQVRSLLVGRRERENTERLAIETSALPSEEHVSEHVERLRALVRGAGKLPPEKSPHPPAEAPDVVAARKVKCPWCGAAPKAPCQNRWTERNLMFVHELRLMEAGVVAKSSSAYAAVGVTLEPTS